MSKMLAPVAYFQRVLYTFGINFLFSLGWELMESWVPIHLMINQTSWEKISFHFCGPRRQAKWPFLQKGQFPPWQDQLIRRCLTSVLDLALASRPFSFSSLYTLICTKLNIRYFIYLKSIFLKKFINQCFFLFSMDLISFDFINGLNIYWNYVKVSGAFRVMVWNMLIGMKSVHRNSIFLDKK